VQFARALEALGDIGQARDQVALVLREDPQHAQALELDGRWTRSRRGGRPAAAAGAKRTLTFLWEEPTLSTVSPGLVVSWQPGEDPHGAWFGEVVQRSEGLRFHFCGGTTGRFRAFLRDPRRWIPHAFTKGSRWNSRSRRSERGAEASHVIKV
jgi:hypothetical protein